MGWNLVTASRGLRGDRHAWEDRVMEDEGFAEYVAARWTSLERSLVVLGCESHEAEDVAQTALVRCYAAWGRVRAADDVDAYVYRVLLNVWAKSRRRRWWGERPTTSLPAAVAADGVEVVMLRADIDRALSGLVAEHREVLVLEVHRRPHGASGGRRARRYRSGP